METCKVYLFDKNNEVQYGLNWGLRESRDPNQSYLQLLPEIYKGDFFPAKGKFFVAETDDNCTLFFTRAQKDYGCALQTPDNNATLGTYIRKRLGVISGSPITKDDIISYGRDYIEFLKLDEMHYRLNFGFNEFPVDKVDSKPTPLLNAPLQQIFFGAPGTGKSHTIKKVCGVYDHFRITFHPDTDYSQFVGSYKPITTKEPLFATIGTNAVPLTHGETGEPLTANKISYTYVAQPFLKAYVKAWQEMQKEEPQPVFLVIEEINRGNCAQIFGDIFQLLDRNENGFSDYPITTDADLQKELAKAFAGLEIPNAEAINSQYDGMDVVGQVKKGSHLLLPNNLYIWATMNTSDQSLFPIDSAFKRRWDWKYIKIADSGLGYRIAVNGKEYDWWQFIEAVNAQIGIDTDQEDKKLGYFFAKTAKNNEDKYIISADKFLSKVLFFLYNDVYKDLGLDNKMFVGEEGKPMSFADYFDHHGNTIEPKVELFLKNLGLSPINDIRTTSDTSIDEPQDVTDEATD